MSPESFQAQLETLGAFIRARRTLARLSLRQLADRAGVSNAYLSQLERGLHEPSLTVLHAVAEGLEVPLEALLAQAGLLGTGAEVPVVQDTEGAIRADPALSEPQRFALLSVYRSFVPPR